MVEYTDQDMTRASRILEGMFQRELRTDEIELGASISDVEADTVQFIAELDLLADLDLTCPAVRLDGDLVPVSLFEFAAPGSVSAERLRRFGRLFPFSEEYFYYARSRWARALEDGPSLTVEAARATFLTRAREFLATRFVGARAQSSKSLPDGSRHNLNMTQYSGGPRVAVPGCHFNVHTNSPGLTAYWSGAYYISSNYLGAPTTPAVGVLQAGTYVFGVAGGAYGSVVQWDMNGVCTLPGAPSVHLNF